MMTTTISKFEFGLKWWGWDWLHKWPNERSSRWASKRRVSEISDCSKWFIYVLCVKFGSGQNPRIVLHKPQIQALRGRYADWPCTRPCTISCVAPVCYLNNGASGRKSLSYWRRGREQIFNTTVGLVGLHQNYVQKCTIYWSHSATKHYLQSSKLTSELCTETQYCR